MVALPPATPFAPSTPSRLFLCLVQPPCRYSDRPTTQATYASALAALHIITVQLTLVASHWTRWYLLPCVEYVVPQSAQRGAVADPSVFQRRPTLDRSWLYGPLWHHSVWRPQVTPQTQRFCAYGPSDVGAGAGSTRRFRAVCFAWLADDRLLIELLGC